MKLELRHLAPYLLYNLNVMINSKITLLRSIHCGESVETKPIIHGYKYCALEYVKPILRPLSDLKKEEFNYLYTLLRVHLGKNKRYKLINEGYGITDLPYFIFEQFLENHFDMFNIINNDLAVDINTL